MLWCGFLSAASAPGPDSGGGNAGLPATTDGVVARMMEADRVLTPQLSAYTSVRRYRLENKRTGKSAEMTVRMSYRYPGIKEFQVLSEAGSALICKRVLRRMLESELAAAREDVRNSTQITPLNYSFRLVGLERPDGRDAFVLEARPRGKNPYLFRGRVWIDAEDYAITRIEGTPAQKPSFWIKNTHFVHRYGKFGPFWLAVSNRSDSDVFVFGHTVVEIQYSDYRLNPQHVVSSADP
jgi:hypothetical protein